jgi:carbonic anhydrase
MSLEVKTQHKRTISRYLQQSHERIFENNRKWVEEKKKEDPQFFDKLAAGQTPEYLYVS